MIYEIRLKDKSIIDKEADEVINGKETISLYFKKSLQVIVMKSDLQIILKVKD